MKEEFIGEKDAKTVVENLIKPKIIKLDIDFYKGYKITSKLPIMKRECDFCKNNTSTKIKFLGLNDDFACCSDCMKKLLSNENTTREEKEAINKLISTVTVGDVKDSGNSGILNFTGDIVKLFKQAKENDIDLVVEYKVSLNEDIITIKAR